MATSMLKISGLARQSKCVLSSIAKGVRKNNFAQPACLISTSKKNKDIASSVQPAQQLPKDAETPEEMFPADPNHEKNWISYGYDLVDKEDDRFFHKVTMFLFVSLGLVGTSFLLAYLPDHKLTDWSQREAYIELARREKEGLPLIDCELIDPSTIELPSEEELGDMEIIV